MACFHPLPAWQFRRLSELIRAGRPIPVEFPCGKCIGCLQSRQRAWALRITHEAASHSTPSSFITLTYDEAHCPSSLNRLDFKNFMRRLIAWHGPTRYFAAGEYGSQTARPHFHAILFACTFPDLRSLGAHTDLSTSSRLQSLWPQGFSSVGAVTPRSAAYVAKYCVKGGVSMMSLRPGIGSAWFHKYWPEVFQARDAVVLQGGIHVRPPRYYDTLLERLSPSLRDSHRYSRVHHAFANRGDSTPGRLHAREICALEAQKRKKERLL